MLNLLKEEKTIKISELREHLSDTFRNLGTTKELIKVELNGMPVGWIISNEDKARLDETYRQDQEDMALIESMRDAFKDVPQDELERELDRVRRELREGKHIDQ